MIDTPPGTALAAIVGRIGRLWPEHTDYVRQRFADQPRRHLDFCAVVAERITRVVDGDLDRLVSNYRWTCEMMLAEEFRFGRTGRYAHDSFDEVVRLVYSDGDFMARYLDGLLLSQLMWANHTRSLETYEHRFLTRLERHMSLLEVGPGHGLLLASAARRRPARLVGWDVSAASLTATGQALAAMGVGSVELRQQDLLAAGGAERFDLVVASELVEHLDRPGDAVRRLAALTRPDGLVDLNIPVNSPAPDHISLWRSPEELFSFVAANGLRIVERHVLPLTGHTEEQARQRRLTLSCVAICRVLAPA